MLGETLLGCVVAFPDVNAKWLLLLPTFEQNCVQVVVSSRRSPEPSADAASKIELLHWRGGLFGDRPHKSIDRPLPGPPAQDRPAVGDSFVIFVGSGICRKYDENVGRHAGVWHDRLEGLVNRNAQAPC